MEQRKDKKKLASGYIDCHCHLTDQRLAADYDKIIANAKQKGINNFVLAGVGPDDWQAQKKLVAAYKKEVFPCFGLHPYWISDHTEMECQNALNILETMLSDSLGLGELGLDFRANIVKGQNAKQILFFEKQWKLAEKYNKVSVLHIVQAHDEAKKIMIKMPHQRPAMVHAFNSNHIVAKAYLDLGFYLSIGGPLLRTNNRALQEAVTYIPIERLLLESDTPDQAPPILQGKKNEPWTILLVAERIAELKGLQTEAVLTQTKKNFVQLFHEEIIDE